MIAAKLLIDLVVLLIVAAVLVETYIHRRKKEKEYEEIDNKKIRLLEEINSKLDKK